MLTLLFTLTTFYLIGHVAIFTGPDPVHTEILASFHMQT